MTIGTGRRRVLAGILGCAVLSGCAEHAPRSVTISPDSQQGIVILSLVSFGGNADEAIFWYRPVGGGTSRGVRMTPSQAGRGTAPDPLLIPGGEIIVLQLQPGAYVFESATSQQRDSLWLRSTSARFAVEFQAIAGKIVYAGQLSPSSVYSGGRLNATLAIHDVKTRDVARAQEVYPGLAGAPVETLLMKPRRAS